jgi:hypothetical protein
MSNQQPAPRPRGWHILLLAGILLAASLSCSVGEAIVGRSAPTLTPTRLLRPTFTPAPDLAVVSQSGSEGPVRGLLPPGVTALPVGTGGAQGNSDTSLVLIATSTPNAAQLATAEATARAATATQQATATSGPTVTPQPTPYVVVVGSAAIGRRGPGTVYDRLGEARQGQQFMILGRSQDSKWWQICCIANQPAWVSADAVTAQGPSDIAPPIPAPPTPTPAPTSTRRPTPTITPTPASPFDVARGPEFPIQRDDGILVIWVKVYEDVYDPKPLPGYVLKVLRNGVDVSSPVQSHDNAAGFDNTGPQQGNFTYNLKFEMPGGGEADWQIYLARPNGSRVSPISKFTTMGDSYRNLTVYIAYLLAR